MKTARLALIVIACGLIGFGCVSIAMAQAQIPADPLTDPRASFDSFTALYKIGWPITVLAGIVVAARLAGRFVPSLSFLAGKPAAVIAAIGAVGSAAFDVLALGGSWASVAMAAVVAFAALWNPHPPAAKPPVADGGGS